MKAWIILITASLIFGVICGIKIKNLFVGVLISGIVPITVFSAVIIYEEYFMPYQGGGASMWPIAILFGGTAAAFIGATGYMITIGINKLLNKSSNKSLKNGTPPIGGAP